MKLKLAAGCLLLISVWNGVMTAGVAHDALGGRLPPVTHYWWAAFLYASIGLLGLVAGALLLINQRADAMTMILWITMTGLAVTLTATNFFSFAGSVAFDALNLNVPNLLGGLLVTALLAPTPWYKSFGFVWPLLFVILLIAAGIVHEVVEPAELRVIDDHYGRPACELWIPKHPSFYLRPFSVAIAMTAWTILCLRPCLPARSSTEAS